MAKETLPEARKLEKLLLELFQFDDAAKLDFGIYRILAQNQKELRAFLRELIEGVPTKLAETAGGERARLVEDLAAYERRRLDDGDDLAEIRLSRGYKERAEKVKAAADVGELAREVFRDLYLFFKRYWDDGDFIAAPRYSKDQYAIPYDGAEVALHWANKDQYYVKSSLFFSDMAVKLGDGRLKFVLAAAVADRDNNKAADGKSRRFTLADGDDAVRAEGTDLIVQLKYGPVTESAAGAEAEEGDETSEAADVDAGEESQGERGGKRPKTPKQDKIDAETAAAIVARAPKEWKPWLEAADNEGKTEMFRRLRRYTKGNSADFFIHKNLRKFLRRELDFFIKNEVFDLDNIDRADLATLEAKLKRVKALRALAHDLIEWLHQVEEFQRKLYLKKRLVLRTDWAVTLDRVPRDLWGEIARAPKQVARWKQLFAVAEIPADMFGPGGDRDVLDTEFVGRNMHLVCETSLLPGELAERVLASLAGAGSPTGTLIHGDNQAALTLLEAEFGGSVDVVFIDPPYNTGSDGFVYKDGYTHSSWLTMISSRLAAARTLMSATGAIFETIDDREFTSAIASLTAAFGEGNHLANVAWQRKYAPSNNAKGIAPVIDHVVMFSRSEKFQVCLLPRSDEAEGRYENPDNDPRGPWKPVDYWNQVTPEERPNLCYDITNPNTGLVITPSKKAWKCSREVYEKQASEGRIYWGKEGTNTVPALKRFLSEVRDGVVPSNFWPWELAGHTDEAKKELEALLGPVEFQTPKPSKLVALCTTLVLRASSGLVLDFFAGTGTTGHSVLNLNREDGLDRRFLLVEMGRHFDTVLVPRILKATYSKDWKDGKPVDRKGMSALYKIIRLESYDDTLENIELRRPDDRQQQLGGGIRKDYLLRYMLNMEASKSMLDLERFRTPFDYKIRALVTHREESGRSWSNVEETPVDLVETFNYLLGLRVKTVQPLGKSGDMRVARYVEGLRRDPQGAWVIKTLVVWRDAKKVDDAKLDEMFDTAQFTEKRPDGTRYIADFNEVYVNGDNRLPNLRLDGEKWKVTLIESAFHELMFDIPNEE